MYAAKNFGLVQSPPPYLSLLAPNSNLSLVLAALITGVSYASADAGILDSTVSLLHASILYSCIYGRRIIQIKATDSLFMRA
jgi:hypothetical protein